MIDEIPEAIRENIEVNKSSPSLPLLAIGGVFCIGIIGLLSVFWFAISTKLPKKTIVESIPPVTTKQPETQPKITTQSPPTAPKTAENKVENLLGHLPYEEAPESELTAITADGRIRLRKAAAAKFQQMQADAKAEGVILTAISGFRSAEAQNDLFFGIKEQRLQDATKRAEVSAPPGYSEHHTGYAIDIGDGKAPSANVNPEFENTAAFRWLEKNAARYSFELSFPPNNPQGVSYEPWHWRFVGDRHSLETFYKVRNLNTSSKN
ncbi:MAG: D-alanyl-D-alanine carboxypeptidase family protein [Pleurocapsa sp.]